ncbi:MAG: phosphoribulokinase [Pseudomonadota bacterium]
MSIEYPIVAITGSSGAGSSFVTRAFEHIFQRERIKAVYIQGSAFHRYEREEMQAQLEKAHEEGRRLSHYGPEGNYLDKLETLFFQYSAMGSGMHRHYLHSREFADKWGQKPGTLTPWEKLKKNSDLLLYRGLHGAAITGDIDISQYPDLTIGVVPNVNLEWIRKIKRDTSLREYSAEEVKQSILDRMYDYVHHITPQFNRTHINLQMIPSVDTSDPFNIENIPEDNECFLVIHFCRQEGKQEGKQRLPDFIKLLQLLPKSFMSRSDTIVVPAGQRTLALELIVAPLIHDLVSKSRKIRKVKKLPKKKKSGLLGHWGQSSM